MFCFGIHTKKANEFGLEETWCFSFKTPTQVLTRQATVLGSVTTEVEVRPLLGLSVTEQYGKPSDGWNMETNSKYIYIYIHRIPFYHNFIIIVI